MKTSLRLLLATIVLAGTFAAAAAPSSSSQTLFGSGSNPMPVCPPSGCDGNLNPR